MTNEERKVLETKIEKAARNLYLYDSSYPVERKQAMDEWNELMYLMPKAGFNWRDDLPHRNCEGEKLW